MDASDETPAKIEEDKFWLGLLLLLRLHVLVCGASRERQDGRLGLQYRPESIKQDERFGFRGVESAGEGKGGANAGAGVGDDP